MFQKEKEYKIHIMAYDLGKPPLNSTGIIHLIVDDTNSHQPIFKQREASIGIKSLLLISW